MNYKGIIEVLLNVDGSLLSDFSRYSKCYLSTTENIKEYQQLFDFTEKNVLTVCGSGDQALSAISNGAKEVTVFDSNEFTKCLLELKKALVLNFDIEKYKMFLDKNSKYFFDEDMFHKIKEDIDEEVFKFYKYILNNIKRKDIFETLFIDYYKDPTKMEEYITYYDEKKYDILKKRIKEVDLEFLYSTIYDLPKHLTKKYDLVLFSNIADYIIDTKKEFERFLLFLEELKKYLYDDSIIQLAYIYNIFHDHQRNPGSYISYGKNRENMLRSDRNNLYMMNQVKGYDDFQIDAALTLVRR